ncbi:hypothetical protein KY285_026138 [Solanum tuberosum]|nr:hypothetical protein KY285_026138 [Solanum tuberosum]
MLIGGIVKPKIVDHKRKYTPFDIWSDVKIYLGIDVNYSLAWRAKEKALISLRGTTAASYSKLLAYLYMMDITYPGSHIRLKKTDKNEFLYLFVALNNCIQGFDHCRLVIVVDGSHLRGPYNGTFVAASTMDGAEKNFRKALKELSLVFYTMAKTCSKVEFDRLMDTVEKVDVGVKEYLELAGYDKWSRCHAKTHRGWAMTSNIAESINAALVSARELPIFNFLEEVRLMFGRWNHDNKHETACTFTPLIGKFQKILIENEAMSTRMGVVPSTEYIYNVTDDGKSFVVCLKNKTCSCGKLQYEEIPCEHAWAVLKRKSLVADGYCSDLYKPKTILKIYGIPIYPLPDVAE